MTPVQPPVIGLQPQVGGSLEPEDIVGRDELVTEMFERLRRGVPLLVTDPRRMGKTHLLDRLVFLGRQPFTVVKIDYEGVITVDQFLRRTIDILRSHQSTGRRVVEAVKPFVPNISMTSGPVSISAAFKARPRPDLFETVVSRVDDHLDDSTILVMALDEVPIAIENIVRQEGTLAADALLQTLRRLRQRPRSKLRWIVTGSIGFHHVVRASQSTEGVINDLDSVPCGPLDVEWARTLARRLLVGIGAEFGEDTVEALIETSGCIPHLLHVVTDKLRGIEPCDRPAVHKAWEDFVHNRDQSRGATHLLTRITGYYGGHEKLAIRLLDVVACATAPLPMDTLLALLPAPPSDDEREAVHTVLDCLLDDHYLQEGPAGFEWRYPVLREIWCVRRRLARP